MGVIQHKALFVVGERFVVRRLHSEARKFNERTVASGELGVPLTPVFRGNNDTYTFAVLPSGSKVGWVRHQDADALMDLIENLARDTRGEYVQTCRVSFGEQGTKVSIDGRGE